MIYDLNKVIDFRPGKLYSNKTRSYLQHVVKHYGEDIVDKLNELSPLAWASGDTLIDGSETANVLILVVDINGMYFHKHAKYTNVRKSRLKSNEVFNYLSSAGVLEDIYIPDEQHLNYVHMILNIPEKFSGIKSKFYEGKYSELYDMDFIQDNINKYYKSGRVTKESDVYRVLTKDKKYKRIFEEQLSVDFSLSKTESYEVTDNMEFDYPPILSEEILNYEE